MNKRIKGPNKTKKEWHEIHIFLLDTSKNFKSINDLIKRNGVLKIARSKERDLFLFLFRMIIGQQLSNVVAKVIWERILDFAEDQEDDLYSLCLKKSKGFKACGISSRKMEALFRLSRSFKNEEISNEMLNKMTQEEVIFKITSLWGLGPWSAEMVLIGFLGKKDVWSNNDGALKRGMNLLLDNSPIQLEIVNRFRPYRSLLAKHVWQGLDDRII